MDLIEEITQAISSTVWDDDMTAEEAIRNGVRSGLTEAVAGGWRIVKTEDSGAHDPPEGFERDPGDDEGEGADPEDWDRSGVFYDDEARPEGCVPLVKVTEEWAP